MNLNLEQLSKKELIDIINKHIENEKKVKRFH